MEIRISIGNNNWVVPSHATQSLISWLNSNAISLGNPRREIHEVLNDGSQDPRQLIME